MALSRRDFQVLQERVSRLEAQIRALEVRLKAQETLLKPTNLVRRVREGEDEEKRTAGRDLSADLSELLRPGEGGN